MAAAETDIINQIRDRLEGLDVYELMMALYVVTVIHSRSVKGGDTP